MLIIENMSSLNKKMNRKTNTAHDSRSSFYFDTVILDTVSASDCFSITKGHLRQCMLLPLYLFIHLF